MKTDLIFSLISAVAAIISVVSCLLSFRHNRFLAVDEFLTTIDNKDFIEARKHVYNNDHFATDDQKAASVVNFFHHWGLLVKKHYLPLWVFKGASGRGAQRLYNRLNGFIMERRKKDADQKHAEYFEWLIFKLKQKGYID